MKKDYLIWFFVFTLSSGLFAEAGYQNGSAPASEALRRDFTALKSEVEELKKMAADFRAEIAAGREEFLYLQKAVYEISLTLNELSRQKTNLENEIALLNAQKTQLKSELGSSRSEIAAIKDDMAEVIKASEKKETVSVQPAESVVVSVVDNGTDSKEKLIAVTTSTTVVKYDNENDSGAENLLNSIYFKPDNVFVENRYKSDLDKIGAQMRTNKDLKVLVRGYSAPAGTLQGQLNVSKARAENTVRYLSRTFNLPADRFIVEWVGAAKLPSKKATGMEKRRTVELFSVT